VDADGEYVVEAEPFLDDDGNPVIVEEEVAAQKTEESPSSSDGDSDNKGPEEKTEPEKTESA